MGTAPRRITDLRQDGVHNAFVGIMKDFTLRKPLRLQFLAGMGLNLYQSDVIYAGMLAHARRFPDELFLASPQTMHALRAGIQHEQGR